MWSNKISVEVWYPALLKISTHISSWSELSFAYTLTNCWFSISNISHENSGILFRIIALSAPMTGHLNNSFETQSTQIGCWKLLVGSFDWSSSALSLGSACVMTDRKQIKENKLFNHVCHKIDNISKIRTVYFSVSSSESMNLGLNLKKEHINTKFK